MGKEAGLTPMCAVETKAELFEMISRGSAADTVGRRSLSIYSSALKFRCDILSTRCHQSHKVYTEERAELLSCRGTYGHDRFSHSNLLVFASRLIMPYIYSFSMASSFSLDLGSTFQYAREVSYCYVTCPSPHAEQAKRPNLPELYVLACSGPI